MARPHGGWKQRLKISEEEMDLLRAYRAALDAAESQAYDMIAAEEAAKRPPMLGGYTRESHQDSKDSGLGEEGQERAIRAMAELVRLEHPELGDITWYREPGAVSAYKIELRDRPMGKQLCRDLRPGDHLIFAYFHRAFRNPADAYNTLLKWERNGITAHFVDLRLDMGTATGRAQMGLMAVFAHWYSDLISELTKAAFANFQAQGRMPNGHAPMGFKLIGRSGKDRRPVPDPEQRRVMAEIVRVRDLYGWSWRKIGDYVQEWLQERKGLPPLKPWESRSWYADRCTKAYKVEKELRAKEARKEADKAAAAQAGEQVLVQPDHGRVDVAGA